MKTPVLYRVISVIFIFMIFMIFMYGVCLLYIVVLFIKIFIYKQAVGFVFLLNSAVDSAFFQVSPLSLHFEKNPP